MQGLQHVGRGRSALDAEGVQTGGRQGRLAALKERQTGMKRN